MPEKTKTGKQHNETGTVRGRGKSQFDYSLLFIVLFLVIFGLVMIYSTSFYNASIEEGDGLFYLRKQAISVAVGLVAMAFTTWFPYYHYEKLAIIIYGVAILMIPLVKTPLGVKVNGATRWIKVMGLSIQPSEYAKLAVIIFTAAVVSKLGRKAINTWKALIVSLLGAFIVAVMVLLLTKNLSSAIIIGGIAFCIYAIASPKNYRVYLLLFLAVAGAGFAVLAVAKGWANELLDFRGERILAWLDIEKYSDGAGFQTLQAMYGIGSGGLWGKGLGKSIQKLGFLPEAQNDMIFSIICEELGLFGGLSILMMFALLLWRIYALSQYCRDMFSMLIVTGVFAHIAIQVIINICVVTNLFPNTGITLPFISYGGSSIIFLLAEMGVLLNISRHLDYESAVSYKKKKNKKQENAEEEGEEE